MRRDLDRQREARDLFLKLHCAMDIAPSRFKIVLTASKPSFAEVVC